MTGSDDAAEKLGKFLRNKREEAGLSLREVARRIRLAPIYLSDIERGRRNPSDETLARIYNFLNIPDDEMAAVSCRVALYQFRKRLEKNSILRAAFSGFMRSVSNQRLPDSQLIGYFQISDDQEPTDVVPAERPSGRRKHSIGHSSRHLRKPKAT